jgi:hypothetical protein
VVESGLILNKKGTFASFSHPDWDNTTARAVGTSGLVTGFAYDTLGFGAVGFIYDSANGSFIDILPSTSITIAQGINARGEVVGSTILGLGGAYPASPPGLYAFLRHKSGAITLFRVNGAPTRARGITDSGLITGFVNVPGGSKGFVASLSAGAGYESLAILDAELLAVPGAVQTIPQAIGNSGHIVGQWDDGVTLRGFIATPLPPKK